MKQRRLLRDHQAPVIVFTTAFAAHALAAFDVGAVNYLLEPIGPDRLPLAPKRAQAFLLGRSVGDVTVEDLVWLSHRGNLVRVDLPAVQRVEAGRYYVRLHVEGRLHLLRETVVHIAMRLTRGYSSASTIPRSSGASWLLACVTRGWCLVRCPSWQCDSPYWP